MSLHRWNPRRDAVEKSIVQALRAIGCEVHYISGKGAPDLLVRHAGMKPGLFYGVEIKTAKGKLTKHQGAFPVWRSVDEALDEVRR